MVGKCYFDSLFWDAVKEGGGFYRMVIHRIVI